MPPRPRPSHAAVAIGGAATVVGSLPGLLTGALAPQLSSAMSFSAAGLGVAFAMQSGVGVLTALPLGRVVDRLGAKRSLRLAMVTTALVSLTIAMGARSYGALVALLVLGACAKRVIEPASNRLLIRNVGQHRLGLAFGMKQSAPPTAAMLAGLSVPLVATTWGWQGAYVLAALMAVVLFGAARRRPSGGRPDGLASVTSTTGTVGEAPHGPSPVAALSLAFGLANAASVTVPIFYVSGAVTSGSRQAVAGVMLSVASAAAIAARLILGAVTDRLGSGHLRLCAVMLLSGAVGFVLLATGQPIAIAAGVVLALAGTWGFSGVFWFTLVRANPGAPGAITGKVAPGALVGATVSPVVFGLVVEHFGYGHGWMFACVMAVLAAVGMAYGDRRLVAADPRADGRPEPHQSVGRRPGSLK